MSLRRQSIRGNLIFEILYLLHYPHLKVWYEQEWVAIISLDSISGSREEGIAQPGYSLQTSMFGQHLKLSPKRVIPFRGHPHMASDDFGSFLTYLPTLIRYHQMEADLPTYPNI